VGDGDSGDLAGLDVLGAGGAQRVGDVGGARMAVGGAW
jgi:hypothetical protein